MTTKLNKQTKKKTVALSNWWQGKLDYKRLWRTSRRDSVAAHLCSKSCSGSELLRRKTFELTWIACVWNLDFLLGPPSMAKCVFVLPSFLSPPSLALHHLSPSLQNSLSVEFNQPFFIRFLCSYVFTSLYREKKEVKILSPISRPLQFNFFCSPKRTWTTTRNILRGCTVSCPATSPRWPVSLRIYMISSHYFFFFSFLLPLFFFLFLPSSRYLSWNLYNSFVENRTTYWLNDFSLFTFSDIH